MNIQLSVKTEIYFTDILANMTFLIHKLKIKEVQNKSLFLFLVIYEISDI